MAIDPKILRDFAGRYAWWQTPEEALEDPERLVARVMDMGDYEDVQRLLKLVCEEDLRRILVSAEAGQFSPRSWSYWHYRLGLTQPGERVPPLPERRLA